MTSLELAIRYFDLSNESDLGRIKLLFNENTTYRSGSGELYLGVDDIILMQRSYHESFKSLHWSIKNIEEIKLGIVQIDFDFEGHTNENETIRYSGIESIIIHGNKIQHIDVSRN